ncbi:hypothetical protein C1H46_014203 [Malus baccata]|uniref:Glyoxalase/fosfomycin resistance/dioxygenase domain-containing protein n=1 Tax=Malus baccata TaxID=106549 RepID=A0A540MN18_MALBA|nr:hypothetical protein C1H46_014203 [Malus baccata]
MAMASKTNTVFAYTVVYVKDVAKSTTFYSKAFGYDILRLEDSNSKTDNLTDAVQTPSSDCERQPIKVCFAYSDVDATYKKRHPSRGFRTKVESHRPLEICSNNKREPAKWESGNKHEPAAEEDKK